MAEEEITPDSPADEPEQSVEAAEVKPAKPVKSKGAKGLNKFKRLLDAYLSKKKLTIPLTILAVIAVVLLIPFTRYTVLGLAVKKDFSVVVLDGTSKQPVSKAQVSIGGKTAETDAKGKATVHVSVGNKALKVTKKYFKDTSGKVLVPLNQKEAYKVTIAATGRQVPVTVINKITGKPLSGAALKAGEAEAKTDKDGKATLVVPAGKDKLDIRLSANNYNDLTASLKVVESAAPENKFALTPSGKVYFLSKKTGQIDVVKTNLDGTDRQTVLAGTGKEDQYNTVLLASRDWKYLALHSRRDGGDHAKLFLIDASTDKVSTMDEGNADFAIAGWSDHRFVYVVNRAGVAAWQPKAHALKSFDAPSGKIAVLDESTAEGTGQYDYAGNYFGENIFILNNEIFYNKNWNGSGNHFGGKQLPVMSVKADGSGKKTVKEFPVPTGYCCYFSLQTRLYNPNEVYVEVPAQDGGNPSYYEYEDGKVTAKTDVTSEKFYEEYPRFILSPGGKQNLWFDQRDGKNAMFIGDAEGENAKQIGSLSEYAAYGWYTDDYLFVSKKDSELYIMPVGGGDPVKVTDYHKPNFNYRGYGGGY